LGLHAALSSASLNVPIRHVSHDESSAVAVPSEYPSPGPHFLIPLSPHVTAPATPENVPVPQLVHVAALNDVWAIGPNLPATHSTPVQLG